MSIRLKRWFPKLDWFLLITILAGLIPASFIIHIIVTDFSGFYFQALSFLKYKSYSYQIISNYCSNPINTGVNARAPLVPLLMAISMKFFGRTLLGIYLPFFIARVLIFPVSYLSARYFLPKKLAFLSVLLLLFIPKLQTYSFSAMEADIFVALFYVAALYFYLKSNKLADRRYHFLSALCLGLGALSKSTGLAIGIGFVLAIFLEHLKEFRQKKFISRLYTYIFIFTLIVGPYLLWTYAAHQQVYLATHKDKSFLYIPHNLPSLLLTIPAYLGINIIGSLKAKLVSLLLLSIFITGIFVSLKRKLFTLSIPLLVTLILIATVSTCLIGGNIVGSYEFITILGFSMIPASILFFIGLNSLSNNLWKLVFHRQAPFLILVFLSVIIFVKYINNYFISPYTLEFIPGEYYISLPTVVKNIEEIHDVNFTEKNGLRIFAGPTSHRLIRTQFSEFRFSPFSIFYKRLVIGFTVISFIAIFLIKQKDNLRD